MADISKCRGTIDKYLCPKRLTCYRYMALENKHWQSWFCDSPPSPLLDDGECGYYWAIETDNGENK